MSPPAIRTVSYTHLDVYKRQYVEYGAADIGVVGKDTILEEGRNIYEVLDLGFGKSKLKLLIYENQLSGVRILHLLTGDAYLLKKLRCV